VGTPVPIGSQPTNMALTSDGQILYTVLSGSQSVALFNMLTQTPEYTYSVPAPQSPFAVALRSISTQPGTENTIALDLGENTGNAIYDFNPATKTAAIRGQNSGPYTGSCLAGANFVPGVAVTWNGSYRTTTIVSATQITVAIPAGDLSTVGSGQLIATNPGAAASNALTVTIN
jgi:DNA-binding beta-propeller fold protein YncE